jgi:hypothetical protein
MHRILELALSLILPFRSRTAENTSPDNPVARISVLASGKILLDGKEATVSEARRALERTKAKRGTVWYYREHGKGEAPPEAIELFKLMVENKLPISLSSKADFSDYLDEEGHSHPRK